jgi:hypothetical protein
MRKLRGVAKTSASRLREIGAHLSTARQESRPTAGAPKKQGRTFRRLDSSLALPLAPPRNRAHLSTARQESRPTAGAPKKLAPPKKQGRTFRRLDNSLALPLAPPRNRGVPFDGSTAVSPYRWCPQETGAYLSTARQQSRLTAGLRSAYPGAQDQLRIMRWSSSTRVSTFLRSLRRPLSGLRSRVLQSVIISRRSRIWAGGRFGFLTCSSTASLI